MKCKIDGREGVEGEEEKMEKEVTEIFHTGLVTGARTGLVNGDCEFSSDVACRR